MKRTGLSILGGVLLLLGSMAAGLMGIAFANPGAAMAMTRQLIEISERQGNLTPEQKQQLEANKAALAEAEVQRSDPEVCARLARLKSYGCFEVAAALVGVIAAIALLAAGGFGKAAALVAAVLGAAACVWGLAIGMPVWMQLIFLVVYAVAFAGALSLRKEIPTTI